MGSGNIRMECYGVYHSVMLEVGVGWSVECGGISSAAGPDAVFSFSPPKEWEYFGVAINCTERPVVVHTIH